MRFTIVLALCFIGAASASSLNKRSFLDDIQNNTQNAFHAFEQFGQTFNEKVQEALKNLLSAFGNKNSSAEASVVVEKRATNPLQLINDLDDPAQFAQTFLKVLLDLATGQGRRKRDIAEDLKKFSEEAKHNAEEALKKLFSFLEQFKSQSSESTEASVVVEKRATNPLQLINDLDDPAQFAQTLLKVLADIATGQGRRKRDIAEDLKKFSDEAKHNAEEALKKLFSFLEQFKPQSSESTEAPVVVEKRATNPLVLINDLSDPAKFAQDFLKVLADMATGQGRRKRDVAEDLKKFADSAKQNAEQGLAKLFEFLEQFKAQFAHDQTDAEKVVSKRDIQETIEKFNELAQTKAQEAFKNIKQALDDLFKGNPFFQSISSHFNNGEDSTEKTVSKRDIFDNFEKFSQNAFENFKQSFERFFNQFSNDDAEAEFFTESD